uniref:Ribonuclease P protein subunit p25-like protein n=1 Tax=Cacopsylla melanoneura TaxID=428564 RepID=A0A8D8XGG4_9HEMI
MENYSKGSNEEEPWDLSKVSIPSIPEDITWMKVSPGAKMRNLLEFALKDFKDKDQILWSGSGPAINKTISCAEIMKHKFSSVHQISTVCYRKVIEYWDPLIDALDQLKVTRDIPTIHILLSKQLLDTTVSGYQDPGNKSVFWKTPYGTPGSNQRPRRNQNRDPNNKNRSVLGLIRHKKSARPRTEPTKTVS